jgi:hypothetical protein
VLTDPLEGVFVRLVVADVDEQRALRRLAPELGERGALVVAGGAQLEAALDPVELELALLCASSARPVVKARVWSTRPVRFSSSSAEKPASWALRAARCRLSATLGASS